ncbi:Peroxidasin-like [Exaiptasia diaphana]|nr:Peroxidasin-like [Exaiptasia diaphana]
MGLLLKTREFASTSHLTDWSRLNVELYIFHTTGEMKFCGYPPQFTTIPDNTTVRKGNSAYLRCKADASPSATIQWSRENDKPLKPGLSQSDGTLGIITAISSDAGKYFCTAINSFGGQNYNATVYAYIAVEYHPSIVYNSSKHTVNESDSVTLTCKADGFPVPKISWTKSAGSVTLHKTGNNYTISHVNRSDDGIYICTASNGIGINATARIKVIVQYKPTIDKESSNKSRVESWNGHTIKLICNVLSSYPAPKWSWNKRSEIIKTSSSISNDSEILVKTEGIADYGLYSCTATNVAGKDVHFINVTQLCKYFSDVTQIL